MRLARFVVVALLVLVPACGGDSQVSEAAATRLQPKVQALREAAATGSQDAAQRELAELRVLVEDLSATDELSDGGARRVLAAAERVEANLSLLAATTTVPPTTTTAPPPPPPPPPPAPDEDDEEEEKKEKEEENKEQEKEEER
ncbi:MAG: hypothetical protein KY439_12400, partial [Actinobacteria bacterium]|nr:hypothetical protein [Actinomycetota bacterium]